MEEEEERAEALAEVVDPLYMFSRQDADAEGEVDDSEVPLPEDAAEGRIDGSSEVNGEGDIKIEVNVISE